MVVGRISIVVCCDQHGGRAEDELYVLVRFYQWEGKKSRNEHARDIRLR